MKPEIDDPILFVRATHQIVFSAIVFHDSIRNWRISKSRKMAEVIIEFIFE